jgi:hypothetical protein
MAKQTLPFYKAARAAQIQEDDLREIMAGQKFPNGPQLHRLVKFLEIEPAALLGLKLPLPPPKRRAGKGRTMICAGRPNGCFELAAPLPPEWRR